MKYLVGTRPSKLSLAQTNTVLEQLKKTSKGIDFEIKTIRTKGDNDVRPLFSINQKGIFEKEIDRAVLDGTVDFAVHSMKDVPSVLPPGLLLACVPKREDPSDVLVNNKGSNLDEMEYGSKIGSSSLRRAIQVIRIRPDLDVRPIRGNVETRLQKMESGEFDGVILAYAGLQRLGLISSLKYSKLSVNDFPPSPGQAALAMVTRENDTNLIQILRQIEDEKTRHEIEAERELSVYVDSGCRFPVGTYAYFENKESLVITIRVYSSDGQKMINVQKKCLPRKSSEVVKAIATELKQKGVYELAHDWRQKVEEWNNK